MKTICNNLVRHKKIPELAGIVAIIIFVCHSHSFAQIELRATPHSHRCLSDTFAIPITTPFDDAISLPNWRARKISLAKSMHPYFRDAYRIIMDLRRLVQMANYQAVTGYESVGDLFDLCQNLPESKQTRLICTVFAGAAVNFFSVAANKQLQKNKINFLRWRSEKVVLSCRFQYLHLHVFQGWHSSGRGLSVPRLRTQFYHQATP